MEQFEFHQAISSYGRAWKALEPGIDEMVLNEDPVTGRRTALQRWQPGAANADQSKVFSHDFFEEVWIAEGDLYDLRLGEGWEKGAYAYRRPGMVHGPWRSDKGCLMFVLSIPVGDKGEEKAP